MEIGEYQEFIHYRRRCLDGVAFPFPPFFRVSQAQVHCEQTQDTLGLNASVLKLDRNHVDGEGRRAE